MLLTGGGGGIGADCDVHGVKSCFCLSLMSLKAAKMTSLMICLSSQIFNLGHDSSFM